MLTLGNVPFTKQLSTAMLVFFEYLFSTICVVWLRKMGKDTLQCKYAASMNFCKGFKFNLRANASVFARDDAVTKSLTNLPSTPISNLTIFHSNNLLSTKIDGS